MTITEHILSLASAYADHHRVALSTVGFRAANHGGFFGRLQSGGSITDQRYQRLVGWFAQNWPADLPWVDAVSMTPSSTPVCEPYHIPATIQPGDAA